MSTRLLTRGLALVLEVIKAIIIDGVGGNGKDNRRFSTPLYSLFLYILDQFQYFIL
jgi:hypothetical protein